MKTFSQSGRRSSTRRIVPCATAAADMGDSLYGTCGIFSLDVPVKMWKAVPYEPGATFTAIYMAPSIGIAMESSPVRASGAEDVPATAAAPIAACGWSGALAGAAGAGCCCT